MPPVWSDTQLAQGHGTGIQSNLQHLCTTPKLHSVPHSCNEEFGSLTLEAFNLCLHYDCCLMASQSSLFSGCHEKLKILMQWLVSKSDKFHENLEDSSSASNILTDNHFHGHMTVAAVIPSADSLISISRIQHFPEMQPFLDSWTLQHCTEDTHGQIFISLDLSTCVHDLHFVIIGNI